MTPLPCPLRSSQCFPHWIGISSYSPGAILAIVIICSAPTPSAVTRIEWGTRGNLEDQFLFSFVNLNHWQILSWRLIRGGFTDQWSHHYSFIISSGVVYYIFVLSLLRVSQRWLSPTIVLQCCRRGFRRTPTNHTNGGPPSLPPLRP